MPKRATRKTSAFTLIELLVVVSIIALLASILLPSFSAAKAQARAAQCLGVLHGLGTAMHYYCSDYNGWFWPGCEYDPPPDGVSSPWKYFWGRSLGPPAGPHTLYARASPFMKYLDYDNNRLLCPDQPKELLVSVQQGVMGTNYGYNADYLDPPAEWINWNSRKSMDRIKHTSELFVFADSAIYWNPPGGWVYQNSTFVDPPNREIKPGQFQINIRPNNQFRHRGRCNSLFVDGHVASSDPVPLRYDSNHQLGFVGSTNQFYYEE